MKPFSISLTGRALIAGIISVVLLVPAQISADVSSILVRKPEGKPDRIETRSGMVVLQSVMEVFDLRSSLDVLGERVDLVGDRGSCRLLLESPLVLSRGLFTILSGPLVSIDGRLAIPPDFLVKALPALTGRSAKLDDRLLKVGRAGTGTFSGHKAEELPRYASFIRQDQYVPEELLVERPRGLSVVVLDPGHGGRSLGARGSTGIMEKELVLKVAEKLKKRLEEGLGVKVVLTRTADYYVGLKERTAIGNNNGADLFLSIHANATFRRDIDGYETYYLNLRTSDARARKLAEAENRALGVKQGEGDAALLEAILWDMAQTEYIEQSSEFAALVQNRLVKELKGRDRGVRQAPFAVLMGARMPAVLVEVGYVSNPEQEVRLKRDSHQAEIARALYKAIEDYHRGLLRGELKRGRR